MSPESSLLLISVTVVAAVMAVMMEVTAGAGRGDGGAVGPGRLKMQGIYVLLLFSH